MQQVADQVKENIGREVLNLIERLYPINRSITGDGVRETLNIMKEYIPLEIHEVASGTKVFDWVIPDEWNVRDAYVKNSRGERVIDWRESNLHVLGYSVPVRAKVTLAELKQHIYTLPEHPDWIPYRTSYYERKWGFCMSQSGLDALAEDTYEVVIEANLSPGSLTYGELYLPGKRSDEVLFSAYTCHPSLCNDNLSGVALLTLLAKYLLDRELNYSYRFVFAPETIGSLTWLSRNEGKVAKIRHGLILTCVGDTGAFTYKRSRSGSAKIDRVVEKVLRDAGGAYEVIDFFPLGSDERQYCSPGFNLSVGSLMRTMYGQYTEYHTSADNLGLVDAESLKGSMARYLDVVYVLDYDDIYINTSPKGEPQLGRRGLYGDDTVQMEAICWILNLSDGRHSLLDIAIKCDLAFNQVRDAADVLLKHKLLRAVQ